MFAERRPIAPSGRALDGEQVGERLIRDQSMALGDFHHLDHDRSVLDDAWSPSSTRLASPRPRPTVQALQFRVAHLAGDAQRFGGRRGRAAAGDARVLADDGAQQPTPHRRGVPTLPQQPLDDLDQVVSTVRTDG